MTIHEPHPSPLMRRTARPKQAEGETDRQYIGRLVAYINLIENELFWYHNLDDRIDDLGRDIATLQRHRRLKEEHE